MPDEATVLRARSWGALDDPTEPFDFMFSPRNWVKVEIEVPLLAAQVPLIVFEVEVELPETVVLFNPNPDGMLAEKVPGAPLTSGAYA